MEEAEGQGSGKEGNQGRGRVSRFPISSVFPSSIFCAILSSLLCFRWRLRIHCAKRGFSPEAAGPVHGGGLHPTADVARMS